MKIFCSIVLFAAALQAQSQGEFRDVAAQAGLTVKLTSGSPDKPYILESMGGGVGLFDYDNDGWLDIYLVNGSTLDAERQGDNPVSNQLYRNNRDGTFTEVTTRAGLADHAWGMGVAVADVDNNGFDDLYITNYGPNRLYLNQGNGTFRDFSRESGTEGSAWSSSAAFADYDKDGDLDLYVSNYLEFDPYNLPKDSRLCRYRGIRVQCGPRGMTATPDRFYENLGGGRFKDAGSRVGLADVAPSYGLGVIWADYDDDGDQDLYVANDSVPNFLFENSGDNTFREVGLLNGVALADDGREQAGMGVDFGDYDNDGDLDLIVTNFSDDYNTLYRNDGDGEFSDVSYVAGLGENSWALLSWGAQFVDLNLDGYVDLLVANGHVYPEVDKQELGAAYRQRTSILLNQADGKFADHGKLAQALRETHSSRGLAIGDVNNDGQMDVLIGNLDAAPTLIRNPGARGHWLLLKLKGTVSNRSAVGARVRVKTGDRAQVREVRSGGSYQSQSDLRVHFGLGSHAIIDEIEIRWPSGPVQKLEKVTADQILVVEEPREPPAS